MENVEEKLRKYESILNTKIEFHKGEARKRERKRDGKDFISDMCAEVLKGVKEELYNIFPEIKPK